MLGSIPGTDQVCACVMRFRWRIGVVCWLCAGPTIQINSCTLLLPYSATSLRLPFLAISVKLPFSATFLRLSFLAIDFFDHDLLSPTLGNITNILRPRPGNYHLASPLRPTDYHRRLLSDPRVITGDFCPTHGIALLIPRKKVISPGGVGQPPIWTTHNRGTIQFLEKRMLEIYL